MAKFTVVSWNVRGLNSAVKHFLVFNYLRKLNPHIYILQETPLIGSRVLSLKRAWVCAHDHASYANYTRGVSILVLLEVRTDSNGRYILIHALILDVQYVIVDVLHLLMHKITQFDVDNVLIVGDFHLVPSR